jgi:hypothetical protein
MVIKEGHPFSPTFQGIHHIYANKKATHGLNSGEYLDGAVLIFDTITSIDRKDSIEEGVRKHVAVMHKDAKKFAKTGGWGFEWFNGNSKSEKMVEDGGKACFDCHVSEKTRGYVFSRLRK